jgi:hypothetical protein
MAVLRVGTLLVCGLALSLLLLLPGAGGADATSKKEDKKKDDFAGKWRKQGVWVDAGDPAMPADFKIQGEYISNGKERDKIGVQVIALSKGYFQAVVYPGGLPGAGWDRKNRSLMDGKLSGDSKATFKPAARGKRHYMGRKPEEFSATEKFPPAGHTDYSATIEGDTLSLKGPDEKTVELKKTVRKSSTLGKEAPKGSIVLYDGSDLKEWTGGRIDPKTKILDTDNHDISTKRKFNNYTVHLEFMTPYKPASRSQDRGNSGFYQVNLYEVQILDSFGLEGKDNECGGIYSLVAPKVNMCYPPLTWQTYDIDFTNAVSDPKSGKKLKNPRITLRHNGVVIHDDVEVKAETVEKKTDVKSPPGALRLQGHGNPVQFRNIWIIDKGK